jgi:NOL1/NOP2/fmu family ribosome biogenesis protein
MYGTPIMIKQSNSSILVMTAMSKNSKVENMGKKIHFSKLLIKVSELKKKGMKPTIIGTTIK